MNGRTSWGRGVQLSYVYGALAWVLLFAPPILADEVEPPDEAAEPTADAEPTDEAAPPSVFYVGAEPGPEAEDRVRAALSALRPPLALDGSPVPLSTLLPKPVGATALSALGSRSAEGCEGEAIDGASYRQALRALGDAVDRLQPTEEAAAALHASWSCLTEPVAPEDPARVDFLAGLSGAESAEELDEERRARIDAAFAQAFAVVPDFPWDPQYTPRAQALFLDARDGVNRAARARVGVVAGLNTLVWVDGRLSDEPLAGVELRPGRHLVQVRRPADLVPRGVVVDVAGEGDVLVVDPAGMAREGEQDDGFAERLRAVLGAMASDTAGQLDHVVSLGSPEEVFRWSGDSGLLLPLSGPGAGVDEAWRKARARVKGHDGGGGALLGLGAGAAVVGAVLAGTSAARAEELRGEMNTFDGYWEHEAEWQSNAQMNQAGWVAIGAGVGVLTIGIHVLAHGARLRRELPAAPAVGVVVAPDGARVAVSGRF